MLLAFASLLRPRRDGPEIIIIWATLFLGLLMLLIV